MSLARHLKPVIVRLDTPDHRYAFMRAEQLYAMGIRRFLIGMELYLCPGFEDRCQWFLSKYEDVRITFGGNFYDIGTTVERALRNLETQFGHYLEFATIYVGLGLGDLRRISHQTYEMELLGLMAADWLEGDRLQPYDREKEFADLLEKIVLPSGLTSILVPAKLLNRRLIRNHEAYSQLSKVASEIVPWWDENADFSRTYGPSWALNNGAAAVILEASTLGKSVESAQNTLQKIAWEINLGATIRNA